MLINSIRLEQKPEKVIHNETLIDFIDAEYKHIPHMIFKASPDKCCQTNLVNTNNKDEFIFENDCEYTIVETPGDPFTAVLAIVAVIAVAAAAYVYFNLPDVSTDQQAGANNNLRARQNRERPLERIEDIAGKVRSYPTLIQEVYRKFNDNKQEVEYSLMAISKGEGEITAVRDSETPLQAILGSGAAFYGPNQLASSDAPFLTVGDTFNEPVKIIIRSNEVSGDQVLNFGEDSSVFADPGDANADQATGVQTGRINVPSSGGPFGIFGTFFKFQSGDENVTQVQLTFQTASGDLSGLYDIVGYDDDFDTIILDAPGGGGVNLVSPDWALIVGNEVNTNSASFIPTNLDNIITRGPFFLPEEDRTEFFVNYAATGLQNDEGNTISVTVQLEYAQADEDGNQIGPWSLPVLTTLVDNTKDRIGKTEEVVTPFTGPCLVRFRRVTDEIGDAQLQNIRLDALYSVSPLGVQNFGDVTTVQVRTIANSGSTQLRERKFNCEFERKLNVINDDGTLGAFQPTKRFIDYFAYAALEPTIGRREPFEVNLQELYDRYIELTDYFGSEDAGEFNYTFDTDQTSFQQILQLACDACFGRAVRRGGVLTYRPELPGIAKTIFTHRNKIPDNQVITRAFESDSQKDGVEFQYVDPKDSAVVTINIPQDGSALRPEKIQSKGIRNHNQAWWQAWRRFQKIKLQRISVNDTFTAEGSLLSVGDIIAITNNTKIKSFGGDVLNITGLLLQLSEPVEFEDNDTHSIALRLRNGTIDIIQCEPGPDAFHVVLQRAPVEELYTGFNEERTKYLFSADQRFMSKEYIVTQIDRSQTFEIPVTAVNYEDGYYERDGEQSPNN